MYGVPLNYGSKTEDFLFVVFQSVSRVNTVNMNASPLHMVLFQKLIINELVKTVPTLWNLMVQHGICGEDTPLETTLRKLNQSIFNLHTVPRVS
jgi:hypothetical protein